MLGRYWPLIAWLLYLIVPTDLFPDTFIGPGWTDDLLLLAAVYYLFFRKGAPWERTTRSRSGAGASSGQSGSAGDSRSQGTGTSRPSSSGPPDPHDILGVTPDADWDTIRKAYHSMANRYHPDKVSHLGEEFQQLAHKKFKEIQWAYNTLAKQRKDGRV
ncbi:Protein of unknown function [Desulfacinum hydrothermale DSM 13146]|uniref:J domain-containing protein n=1 Tax=Desulfacinum hydrothermale DSM 13146 TaxID=1121390 RepID=A0A1W1X5H3_9BACT|nr:DnaJ domain-containing protein [Desulfacinum hydrothermale]SMC18721.1 Protein of unknown function [Desulfacinum hydrothermale DSM 13146]